MYCEHFEESLWESCSFPHVMSEGQRRSLGSLQQDSNLISSKYRLALFPRLILTSYGETEARLVKSKLISYV